MKDTGELGKRVHKAGNPHVRFEEGAVSSAATPRRRYLLCKNLKVMVGCALAATIFSGCMTDSVVRSKCDALRDEIRSGGNSKSYILDHAIFDGEIEAWVFLERTEVPISLEERMKFVDCANLDYLVKRYPRSYNELKDIGDTKGAILSNFCAIRSRFDERILRLLPTATKEQKATFVCDRKGLRVSNVDSNFLKRFLATLNEKELSEKVWHGNYLWKMLDYDKQEIFIDVFLQKVQSADSICRLLELNTNIKPELRTKIEATLLPKVQQVTDTDACMTILYNRYVANPKLVVKMISLLPDDKRTTLADRYLGTWSDSYKAHHWWGNPPSYNLLNYGAICALTAKSPDVAKKISDWVLMNLEECRDYPPKDNAKWDGSHEKRAESMIRRLISVAGEDWLESVLSRTKDCPSFVIACVTPKMADKLLTASKVCNSNTQAALAKIATINITKFNEDQVAKILSKAKAKVNSTFVLNGFYLGMPIEDAHMLLRHYFPESRITIVSDSETNNRNIEIDPVKSDMAKEGEATDMYFCQADRNGKVYRLNFNRKILKKWFMYDVQTYREWAARFGRQYNCDFRGYRPKREISSGSVFMAVSQEAYRYKNSLKDYAVTYFGKVEVYDPNEKSGMNALRNNDLYSFGVAEGVRFWINGGGWANSEGGKEGTLRVETMNE